MSCEGCSHDRPRGLLQLQISMAFPPSSVQCSLFTLHAPPHHLPFPCHALTRTRLLHPIVERRQGREDFRRQPMRKKAARVMRKARMTTTPGETRWESLTARDLPERRRGVLSGCAKQGLSRKHIDGSSAIHAIVQGGDETWNGRQE